MRVLLFTGFLCFATPARADSAWLELESSCPISAEALAQRVSAALVGARDPELAAAVTIDQVGDAYDVALRTERAGVPLATKVVTAPSCDEAVEAAAVVLALALGESVAPAPEPAPESAPSVPTIREPELAVAPVWSKIAREPRRDLGLQGQSKSALRFALAAGLDTSTLSVSTAYLAARLNHGFGGLELYGELVYGVPHVEETASDTGSERLRLDFGGLGLGACYGVGRALHVSACAGGELAVLRRAHELHLEDRTPVETEALTARLSGVLTALLAYRGGAIEPQLELATIGPDLGLRAGMGAAVRF